MSNYEWITLRPSYGPPREILKIGSVRIGHHSISLSSRRKFTAKFYLTNEIASFSTENECKMFLVSCLDKWLEKANLTYKGE